MRTPETEALLRKLLRENRGIALGEMHSQLACRQFMIEHMDIFAEEGVKSLFTELFIHPDHYQTYSGNNFTDTEKQLELLDLTAALCVKYPGKQYGTNKNLALDWFLHRADMPIEQQEELRGLYDTFAEHPYSVTKLFECAKQHGISIVGANLSAPNRYEVMLNETKKFFDDHADSKIIIHAGSRHVTNGKDGVKGMGEDMGIPVVGVFNGPQTTPVVIPDGASHLDWPNEVPMRHDYLVQGRQAEVTGIAIDYPENYVSEMNIIDPRTQTRTNCSSRTAPLASVTESHTAAVVDGTAEHAQKALSDKQASTGVEKT